MQISSVSASNYTQQMQQAMFQKADSNDDGSLSLKEFAAADPAKNTGTTNSTDTTRAEKLFKSIDTDGDGKASESEMGAFTSKLSSETQSSLMSLQQAQGGQGPKADGAGHMPPPPPPSSDGSDSTDSSTTTLADILAGISSSSSTSDSSSTNTLADILNQVSSSDSGTTDDGTTDISKQLSAYLSQMLSNYSDQAKSSANSISVSA